MQSEYGEWIQREIVTTRVFDAPRSMVFEAWTDPDQLKEWWGPKGFTNTFHVFEFKPGGVWTYTMHGPDGRNYENENRFVEIVFPERIVLEHTSDPKFRLSVLFEDLGKRTKITFRQLFDTSATYQEVKSRATIGNEQNMDRLVDFLSKREVH